MLRNDTPSLRAAVHPLAGHSGQSLRPAYVSDATPTRFIVPGDWITRRRAETLAAPGRNYPVTTRNSVEYYVNATTYAAMCEALLTATGPEHSVTLLGWLVDVGTFTPDSPRAGAYARMRFADVFIDLARRGVRVRLLLWSRWIRRVEHDGVLAALSGVENVEVVLDGFTNPAGSHHQKLLLVDGREGLIAFYGGVDLNPDRYSVSHDVHARVRGPAADQLHAIARERWRTANMDLRAVADGVLAAATLGLSALVRPPTQPELPTPAPSGPHGHSWVVVTQTRGNVAMRVESDLGPMLRSVIGHARRFVYVEDQYFTNEEEAHLLIEAAARVKLLVVMLPEQNATEPSAIAPRVNLLRTLARSTPAQAGKILVFERTPGSNEYVHAKVWIVDDEVAVVGSANFNRRGWHVDSELHCAHVDRVGAPWDSLELSGPRKLRMRLWKEHLGGRLATYRDPLASAVRWRSLHRSPIMLDTWHRARAYRVNADGLVMGWWATHHEPRVFEPPSARLGQHVRLMED